MAAVLPRLACLGHDRSALAPRIAALLSFSEVSDGEGWPDDAYFRLVPVADDTEAGGSEALAGAVPVLDWNWWRKRKFLSEEDETRAREANVSVVERRTMKEDETGNKARKRKEQAWVDALYAEFAGVIPHLKRAALLLNSRIGYSAKIPSLVPLLRWLRSSDAGWEEELMRERTRSPWVACTMLVTYIEKAMGDLLSWSTDGRQRVPRRINDLLAEPALETLLGSDPIYLVRAVVGPPSGINIRNLLWHGFLDQAQFHPAYLDFLIVLVASLGLLLGDSRDAFCEWEISLHSHQPQAAPSIDSSARRFSRKSRRGKGGAGNALRQLEALGTRYKHALQAWDPPNLCDDASTHFSEARELLSRSFFILPQRVSAWIEVLRCWIGVNPESNDFSTTSKREDYRGLLIALPEFEHSLRRVFVAINEFAEERLLTAEAAVYYTTLEIMTAERHDPDAYAEGDNYITGDTNAPFNLLPIELGQGVMHLLRDLNDWTTGPRLRIKVSHGLADRHDIHPSLLVQNLLMVAIITLCARYDPAPNRQGTFTKRCITIAERYTPYFHPVSLLQRRALCCYEMWRFFHANTVTPDAQMPLPPAADLTSNGEEPSVTLEDAQRQKSKLQSLVDEVISQLNANRNVPPLFILPPAVNEESGATDASTSSCDPDLNAFRLLNMRVFCTKHEESVLTVLTDSVNVACALLEEIESKYKALGNLVRERKAYHQQRRNYCKLRLSLPYFALVVQLNMLLVEETARAQDMLESQRQADRTPQDGKLAHESCHNDADRRKEEAKREKLAIEQSPTFVFARSLSDLLGRLLACSRDNEWDKAKEIISCWLGDDSRTYRLLSHRERDKFSAAFLNLRCTL